MTSSEQPQPEEISLLDFQTAQIIGTGDNVLSMCAFGAYLFSYYHSRKTESEMTSAMPNSELHPSEAAKLVRDATRLVRRMEPSIEAAVHRDARHLKREVDTVLPNDRVRRLEEFY